MSQNIPLQNAAGKNSVSPGFCRVATRCLIGISLALLATPTEDASPPLSAPLGVPPAPLPLAAFDGTVVTWGDSIGNGLGNDIAAGNEVPVINRGKDGAGLLLPDNQPRPLGPVPRGAVVLMSIGTNDVGTLLESTPGGINAYAARVVSLAQQVKMQGATPILIGIQAPTGPYKGNPRLWNKPGFLETWDRAMKEVNAAIAGAAHRAGIFYSTVQDRVPERAADRLHYTPDGSVHIANNALADAGVTARFAPPPPKIPRKTPEKG